MILAYLIGELHKKDKKIYIDLSKGMLIREEDEEKIYRILKSLYSLKQSVRLWNKKIITYLFIYLFKFYVHMRPCGYDRRP